MALRRWAYIWVQAYIKWMVTSGITQQVVHEKRQRKENLFQFFYKNRKNEKENI